MSAADRGRARERLLAVKELLERKTDEEHPMGAAALLAALERRGLPSERKAVYRDIEALRAAGYDVVYTRTPTPGYFWGERAFELAEVRLLVDAVLSAEFLTRRKSLQLTDRLLGLLSERQAEALRRQIYIDRRGKQQNEEIFYTIDALHRAVAARRKITFSYVRRRLDPQKGVVQTARTLTVSPYALLWYDDRYYLIGNYEKYDDLLHLRADRMRGVRQTGEVCRPFEEVSPYRGSFDVADYAKKLAGAFAGKPMTVELVCQNELLEAMLDRFGAEVPVTPLPDGRFALRPTVAVSEGLVRELLAFGPGVEARFPERLRERLEQAAAELYALYHPSQG